MTPQCQRDIDQYWANEMGIPSDFHPVAGRVYCTVQELYSGVQVFLRDGWLVIAAPPDRADPTTSSVRGLAVREVFSVEFVERVLALDASKVLGPAHVSYADAGCFLPFSADSCRLLTPDDAAHVRALAQALSGSELEQSGFDERDAPAFGAFADGVLCAVASYQIWKPKIAHITVATRPGYRRRGYGRAAVSALAAHAHGGGLVLQYRALASNVNSVALGQSLGFEKYCSTIYARLPAVRGSTSIHDA